MDLRLNGQTAIVTGASRGIGLAVTRGLVAEGVRVAAGALKSSAELDELTGTGLVRVVQVDLADPGGPAALVAAAGDRIDILVNNVGAAPARPGGFAEITDEDWQTSLTLNLMAAVRTTRAALPVMLAAGKGAIVNISSVNAFLPDPAVMDYSAAKAALANFSKIPVQGGRPARHPGQHDQPGPGRHRPVARRGRGRGDGQPRDRRQPPGGPEPGSTPDGDRPVQPPGRGRRPGAHPGQRPHGQRDRRRHHHRRRPHPHLVAQGSRSPPPGRCGSRSHFRYSACV
jgi:hypothetical protein